MKYAFNGYLFSQRQTGVMRFAREILLGIDKLCKNNEFILVVPEYAESVPKLNKIKIEKYGATRGNMWEQKDFVKYLKSHDLDSVNFNNTMPLLRPGIIVIHDIAYKIHPEFGSTFHGKISNFYHRIIFGKASKSNKPIITVTYFSKYQLIDEYKIEPNRIHVIGNAWQHINKYGYDDSILKKNNLMKNSYYFSLGSLSKMKNTKWFIDVAEKHPEETFVLSGVQASGDREKFNIPSNVIKTGFISDEQVKSLIRDCKAFIYPSIYDGFGIPPLEALSQGTQVICSSAACLPEVYRNCVHYIDPYDTNVDIEKLLNEPVDDAQEVLSRYSWEKSTKEFYNLLEN